MSKTSQYDSQAGLTLLEVMLAVTLIALGIIPLLITHGASIRHFVRSREVTQGGLLAQERISLLQADGFQEEVSAGGQFEGHPYLEWEEKVSPVRPGLMAAVEVRVRPAAAVALKAGRGVELVSYLVNPRFAPSEEGSGKEQTAAATEVETVAEISSSAPPTRGLDPVEFRPVPVPVFTPYTPPARGLRPGEPSIPVPTFSPVGRDDGFLPPPGGPVPVMTPF
jgi:Tfp pilus assembly protein PilV